MTARVILHLPEDYHDRYRTAPHLALYPRIESVLAARGGCVVIAGRDPQMFGSASRAGDGDLHVVESGVVQGPGWLNAALAYLPGYWHLDPLGVLADSSIAARPFAPETVTEAEAAAFLADLRQRFVGPRLSRYSQMRRVQALPAGAIAVFLQGPAPERRRQAHMPMIEMLRAVVRGAGGRPVVVKAHPLKPEPGLAAIAEVRAEGFDLTVTEANVHDVLAAAAVTVSINSAASIEGLMHGKPAILFGRSDFAALAQVVTDPADFAPVLARALAAPVEAARGLTWYFRRNCLPLDAPDFADRVLAVFAQAGFGPERLGLQDR